MEQTFQVAHKQFLKARLDIVNLTDNTYQLRSGSGVGVNAAQYGDAPRSLWLAELPFLTRVETVDNPGQSDENLIWWWKVISYSRTWPGFACPGRKAILNARWRG